MKKIIAITLAAVVVLGGGVAINHSFAEEKQPADVIGIDKAKEAAQKKVDGVVEDVELEMENGKSTYEVEVDKDNKEYDIHVDGTTAAISRVDERDDNDDDDDFDDTNATATNKTVITEKEAIEIAKTKIDGELIEVELDHDDGRYEYNMEFRTANGEAEITVNAETKEIIELEHDDD